MDEAYAKYMDRLKGIDRRMIDLLYRRGWEHRWQGLATLDPLQRRVRVNNEQWYWADACRAMK